MARRVIDLSQPLSRESQLHPFFPPTQVLRHIQHTDAAPGRPSFNAEIIITSNHAATHVDAFGHYDPTGVKIADMPLDTFCGDAICVDIRDYPGGHDVTAAEVEQAVGGLGPGAPRRRHPALLLRPLQPHRRNACVPRRLQRHLRRGRPLDGRPRREDLRRRDDQPRPRLHHRRVPDPPRVRRAPADALREPEQPEGGRQPPVPVLRLPAASSSPPTARRSARSASSTTEAAGHETTAVCVLSAGWSTPLSDPVTTTRSVWPLSAALAV